MLIITAIKRQAEVNVTDHYRQIKLVTYDFFVLKFRFSTKLTTFRFFFIMLTMLMLQATFTLKLIHQIISIVQNMYNIQDDLT